MRDLCYLSIFHNHTYNRYAILLHLKIEGNIQDLKPLNLKVHSNGRFVIGIENVVTKSENLQAINQAKNTRSVVHTVSRGLLCTYLGDFFTSPWLARRRR